LQIQSENSFISERVTVNSRERLSRTRPCSSTGAVPHTTAVKLMMLHYYTSHMLDKMT